MSAAAPAPSAQAPKEQYGRVKQVLSGDTIIIQGPARGGPPPERTLSLSGISAPRLARRPNPKDPSESKDEPFAWESREFLRKLLVGKDIVFTVEYKVPSGREFGNVFVGPNKENVTQALVKEGLAAIREGSGKGGPSAQAVELAGIASGAQSAKKGVHGSPESLAAHVRNVVWTLENPRALVDSAKGKPIDAVVESVRDGATLRVTLLPGHQNVTVVLSGIKTPTFKKVGDKDVPEPYAEEAKFFVETRLLQRDVKIVLEGVTGQNLLGTVLHPKGNISELLLENGYAKIVDWSFGNVTSGRERLRAAENTAKANKTRLWTDHKVSEKAMIADRDFTAVVEEVVNPECVVVSHNGESKKLFLSSIRQPRPPKDEAAPAATAAPAGAKKRQNYWEIPWMFEARDFMRKKLVGQKVQAHIDFIKPAADGFPTRVCATLKVGDINVAEALVSKGFATVVRYRESEEDRASDYDDLLAAEARAAKNLKGVHAQKDIPVHRINDITTRAIAEKLLPSFTRAGRLHAVVEHVQSGSRLRVLIPKESSIITLLLAGISCPRSGSADKPAEPYGDEALALTRSLALQHDVEVEIEEIDKNGAFVGHLYIGSTNLSAALLTNGYAKLHPSSERYKNSGTLGVAEAEAKNVRKNIWAGFVEPVAEVKQAEEEPRQRKLDYKSVLVTEVSDTTTFWAQDSSASSQLDNIMQTISSAFEQNPPLAGARTAKRGELIAAKFSADGQWYRARVLKVQGQSAIDVVYVDFGNKETLTNESIAALPSGVSGPALASEYRIAFLVAPPGEWAADALASLRDSILNHTISINVEYRDGPTEFVTILDENNQDVGKELVEQGQMTFKARSSAHLAPLMNEYGTAQQNAKAARQGIWMYGDISEDDAKEFGRGRP